MIEYTGTVVSSGMAIGRVFLYKPFVPEIIRSEILDSEVELNLTQFEQALAAAGSELVKLQEKYAALNPEKCEILSAHQVMLEDEEICDGIRRAITEDHKCAAWAIQLTYDTFIDILSGLDDPLIRERTADMQDVHNRLQRCLQGVPESALNCLAQPGILVAEDLLPSDAVSLDVKSVLGILTERGGTTSHTAIIAKSHGIPAILGIKDACTIFENGQEIVLDALKGVVLAQLSEEEMRLSRDKLASCLKDREEAGNYLRREARTKDGVRIEIKINIGSAGDKALEAENYTDGVGLFRSEFLYMESSCLPSEEAQFSAYKKVLEAYGSKPVILRTLDIGGDKKLPYMDLPTEENPFLGKRALRLCLERKDIFKTQLRAALRASNYGNLWIMFPMVGSLDDIEAAMGIVSEARAELDREGAPYRSDIKYGIMVEIPAIALVSEFAAEMVDFASVGTNDLCQYLTATDRMNPELVSYYQTYHPAMFRILRELIGNFAAKGKSISICGEAGGDPAFVIPLIGFGMRSFSMSASSLAAMKRMIAHLDMETASLAAENVLKMSRAQEIKQYLTALSLHLLDSQADTNKV